jgi:hypothetical protein
MCGYEQRLPLRPYRRTAHNYWRTASMLTGMLCYAERVEPGWVGEGRSFDLVAPGGLVGTGERWCKTFLSVAHGEATLRGVNHGLWTSWRDTAFERTSEFRRTFDPLDTISAFALGAGISIETLARALTNDSKLDPIGAAARAAAE